MNRGAIFSLIIGLLLTVVIMIPPVQSAMQVGNLFATFGIIFHAILFIALFLPFLLIYLIFRTNASNLWPAVLGIMFSLGHLWLAYSTFTFPPQEFGYLGLIFAPVLEATIAIPLGALFVFITKRAYKN